MPTMSTHQVTLPITGLGCASSSAIIVERALLLVPGVTRAYVNAATEMAYVEFDPARTEVGQLIAAIERSGFYTSGAIPR